MSLTLHVVDNDAILPEVKLNIISFQHYLRDYPKLNEPKIRIINLCDTARYLSHGYYCSLLAEARQHRVVPSVKTINALREKSVSLWFDLSILGSNKTVGEQDSFIMCMGESENPQFNKIAARIYETYKCPILKVTLVPGQGGVHVQISRCSISEITAEQQEFCWKVLEASEEKSWRTKGTSKKYRWDLAMLVDPNESAPPSDKGALERFVKAGAKLGLHVHKVLANDLKSVSQYDALFIRQTTAIDHITYRLACDAEAQGLVVIDDSDSILRCCNKVFLHDAFQYNKVASPRTLVIDDVKEQTLDNLEANFDYPIVLKMPEGSFSKGVFKVNSRAELQKVTEDLLRDSALVLAQEYLYTEYDWRIGVLNGRALYACRYYMATNHWQIYNHGSKRNFSGGFDALPTFEVPSFVLSSALKAAAVVGSGFYGVDIKAIDGKAYVLEVNDNPNVDHEVEDAYLGEELYMQIMSEFLRRLEARGR